MRTTILLVAVTATALSLAAQEASPEANARMKKMAAEQLEVMTVSSSNVKGAPYSANIISTSIQTLGDGNRITNKTEMKIVRDSEGRTRREQNTSSVGPWSTGQKGIITVIVDPVAGVEYTIPPHGDVAMKRPMKSSAQMSPEAAFKLKKEAETELLISKQKLAVGTGRTADDMQKIELLGSQMIEGVMASGKRLSRTFAAGDIGNEKPITVSTESWYSPELQTVILSKRSDPRTGDTEYRLTNINRSEPAKSLFQVPATYSVQ